MSIEVDEAWYVAVKNAIASAWNLATRADGRRYTHVDTTAPSAPVLTAVQSPTVPTSQIDLTVTSGVDANSEILGHNIYAGATVTGPFSLLANITGTTYTNSNLPQLTPRYYCGTTINAFGLESDFSAVVTATTGAPDTSTTGFPVYARYVAAITALGGTPILATNTRYWSGKPTLPAAGNVFAPGAALDAAIAAATTGDTVRVANGTYANRAITLNKSGVTLAAQTQDGVIFTGTSKITINANSTNVYGFKWLNSLRTAGSCFDGTGTDNVVALNTFDHAESSGANTAIVGMKGNRNRFCYNTFAGGVSTGRYIHIQDAPAPLYNRIDNNKFLNKSGGVQGDDTEIIQVGQDQAGTPYYALIDSNHFENYTAADGEIVSIKAGEVLWMNNVQIGCVGRWNFRASARSIVYGNWVLGNGNNGAGGFVMQGPNHILACNYFDGLNGSDQATLKNAICFAKGGTSNYVAASNSEASFNTIYNCKRPFDIGNGGVGTIIPTGILLYKNAVEKAGASDSISDAAGATASGGGNVMEATVGMVGAWVTSATPAYTASTPGSYRVPTAAGNLAATGTASGFASFITVDILGTAIPASAPNVGCFQAGYAFTNDPVQLILTNAGA